MPVCTVQYLTLIAGAQLFNFLISMIYLSITLWPSVWLDASLAYFTDLSKVFLCSLFVKVVVAIAAISFQFSKLTFVTANTIRLAGR